MDYSAGSCVGTHSGDSQDHCSMPRWAKALALSMVFLSGHASADALSAGKKALSKREWTIAYEKFKRSKKPEASYLIGDMAMKSLIKDCDLNCALEWHRSAAQGNYVPAVTAIAILFLNDGQRAKAIEIFTLAARWNDADARRLMAEMSLSVPAPDLWDSYQESLRQAAAQRAASQAAAQEAWVTALSIGAGIYAAKGNATLQAQQSRAWTNQHQAPLVGERVVGYQRVCQYQTNEQVVTLTVSATTSCLRALAY